MRWTKWISVIASLIAIGAFLWAVYAEHAQWENHVAETSAIAKLLEERHSVSQVASIESDSDSGIWSWLWDQRHWVILSGGLLVMMFYRPTRSSS